MIVGGQDAPSRHDKRDLKGVQAGNDKLRVFVSYSRNDVEFADQLVAGLEACGFDPILDRHGISGGEDWQQRLGARPDSGVDEHIGPG
jgi:hypothetical protein